MAKRDRIQINAYIEAEYVRVVDPNGKHGVYSIDEARAMAQDQGLDLVEIAPTARPPVCKIMDYGKYQYEQKKKERESRKRQHQTQLKEVRFRPRTDTHDFEFKTKHASEFLIEGNKVRAFVMFRGREVIHQDQGRAILDRFSEALKDVAAVDQEPRMEGRRRMTMILSPLKAK